MLREQRRGAPSPTLSPQPAMSPAPISTASAATTIENVFVVLRPVLPAASVCSARAVKVPWPSAAELTRTRRPAARGGQRLDREAGGDRAR